MMNKLRSFMEKLKRYFWICFVVWLAFAILLIAPITYTYTNAIHSGEDWIMAFALNLIDNIKQLSIKFVFDSKYISDYLHGLLIYTVIFIFAVIIGTKKLSAKSEYDNIEHGSSDWCKPGEQYKILNKKEGLILAKDNYLPLDKTGNINVLIVGRIWCW